MISSLQHPQIKLLKSLHAKKGRNLHKQFLAEGIRVCSTLITNGAHLVTLYVIKEFMAQAQALCTPELITLVTPQVIEQISFSTTASGVIGLFNIPPQQHPDVATNGIVLSEISDPGNMGTLIRTAAAMNIKTAFIVGGTDIWAPKVVQASAGTIACLTIVTILWHEILRIAQDNNLILSALVVKDGLDPQTIDHSRNRFVIVGNEAHGIRPEWVADCQEKITLNMPGNTESLNAAVAGSIALYVIYNKA